MKNETSSEKLISDLMNGRLLYVRQHAAQALGELAESNPDIIAALLITEESDESEDVKEAAQQALKAEQHKSIMFNQSAAVNKLLPLYRAQKYRPSALADDVQKQEKRIQNQMTVSRLVTSFIVIALELINSSHPLRNWHGPILIGILIIWIAVDAATKTKSIAYKGWLSTINIMLEHGISLIPFIFATYLLEYKAIITSLGTIILIVFGILEWGRL